MKKVIIMISVFLFIMLFLLNYTTIVPSTISKFQYKESVSSMYVGEFEPKDKIADIYIAALDSIMSERISPKGEIYKTFKYVAIDTKLMPNISDKEVQYMLTYFKSYNDTPIYASIEELKGFGLFSPLTKNLREGLLLSIREVIEITNEKAVLMVFYYESGSSGGGDICTLVYKDNRWQVESLELKYIS